MALWAWASAASASPAFSQVADNSRGAAPRWDSLAAPATIASASRRAPSTSPAARCCRARSAAGAPPSTIELLERRGVALLECTQVRAFQVSSVRDHVGQRRMFESRADRRPDLRHERRIRREPNRDLDILAAARRDGLHHPEVAHHPLAAPLAVLPPDDA